MVYKFNWNLILLYSLSKWKGLMESCYNLHLSVHAITNHWLILQMAYVEFHVQWIKFLTHHKTKGKWNMAITACEWEHLIYEHIHKHCPPATPSLSQPLPLFPSLFGFVDVQCCLLICVPPSVSRLGFTALIYMTSLTIYSNTLLSILKCVGLITS